MCQTKYTQIMILVKSALYSLPAYVNGTIQPCQYRVVAHMKGNRYVLKAVSYFVKPQLRTIIKSGK